MFTRPVPKRSPTKGALDDALGPRMGVANRPAENAPGGDSGAQLEHSGGTPLRLEPPRRRPRRPRDIFRNRAEKRRKRGKGGDLRRENTTLPPLPAFLGPTGKTVGELPAPRQPRRLP